MKRQLSVTFVSLGYVTKGKSEDGNTRSKQRGIRVEPDLALEVLDNNLEGAGYGAGGADSFSKSAPVALLGLDYSDDIINQYQRLEGAYANA